MKLHREGEKWFERDNPTNKHQKESRERFCLMISWTVFLDPFLERGSHIPWVGL